MLINAVGDPWKKGAFVYANHWENPLRSGWGLIVLWCVSSGEAFVWLCGWKVGQPGWNTYLLQALFPRLWAGSHGAELQCLSTGCGLRPLWLQRPGSFAYRDSMEAQARFKAQWKTNQALRINSQISFVFPSFMRKAKIFVPCCWLKSWKNKMLPVIPTVTLHPLF